MRLFDLHRITNSMGLETLDDLLKTLDDFPKKHDVFPKDHDDFPQKHDVWDQQAMRQRFCINKFYTSQLSEDSAGYFLQSTSPRGFVIPEVITADLQSAITHPVDSEIHRDKTRTQSKTKNNPSHLHKREGTMNQPLNC